MPIRPQRDICAFGQTLAVACPQCSKRATLVDRGDADKPDIFFSCSNCGFMRQWQQPDDKIDLVSGFKWFSENPVKVGFPIAAGSDGQDVYIAVETLPDATQEPKGLSFRLWLQTLCNGENLWFLNSEHLAFVQAFTQVPLENRYSSPHTESSRKQIQWLEEWVMQTENKDIVLGCLTKLQTER